MERRTTNPTEHEALVIGAFVTPARRRRMRELHAVPARRRKLIGELLAGVDSFDPRCVRTIPPGQQGAADIERLLRSRGAPSTCHAMSENGEVDGRDLPLADALAEIVGWGASSLLSCLPGRLAYFEGEEPNERYLLERGIVDPERVRRFAG
jgi:hypothetical protein